MKKILITLFVISMLVVSAGFVLAAKPTSFDSNGVEKGWEKNSCTSIQDGILYASTGELLTTGYDQFGYNYQAHMFNGRYCDYDRVIGGASCDVDLIMKWSDDWLGNQDCNGDGKLDRGGLSNISQGWLTNHMWGSYEQDGETCKWDYFVKIVYPCMDFDDEGECIWSAYTPIQRIYNDPCADVTGVEYKVPAPVGFGYYN